MQTYELIEDLMISITLVIIIIFLFFVYFLLQLKKCFTKIKIGLFGGGGIGCKTALAVRFLRGTFFEKYFFFLFF